MSLGVLIQRPFRQNESCTHAPSCPSATANPDLLRGDTKMHALMVHLGPNHVHIYNYILMFMANGQVSLGSAKQPSEVGVSSHEAALDTFHGAPMPRTAASVVQLLRRCAAVAPGLPALEHEARRRRCP